MDLQLSKNFYLSEFTRSEVAERQGRPVTVKPGSVVEGNLKRLCAQVLQPLRDGAPGELFVSSGFRPPWLNRAVGGSPKSQHLWGEAADVVAKGKSPLWLCRRVIELGLPFEQLIYEFGRWAHVSVAREGHPPGKQVFTAVKRLGRTLYLSGLVEV